VLTVLMSRTSFLSVPSDFQLKLMNTVHRGLLKISAGRAGWQVKQMPVLELTTIGRRTGKPRSVMLTSPMQRGSAFVVVASRGGDTQPPAWLLNLQANPEVVVARHGEVGQAMRARVATVQERELWWPVITSQHTMYAGYQALTSRQIALVLLEPVKESVTDEQ
jgi:deazaflavin-dependent oxidoreductase (nitroreductase family)